ncbi:hypothetical protein A3D77_07930 [Candidatus Gottesmanbacteria bacterium RIFCSPHIGHO2_02_FULL_39_11]|uniref:Transmembrane protein n=1 Tax=Candidatus Gottesmanbacteria bacterium RIFCSPHIGHO2_02_FULL_39_11 TaxID=1798382 RepID=A0A1F5ZMB5_9BACT|nr:MAG: hypothetical protein A3D77_07930 [Candidatus Gottesmanbacteria bacterium RIFCSPHIGHO2_02_FULL_39_11]
MKFSKYINIAILFVVTSAILVIYVIVQKPKPEYKQGPIDIACTSEGGRLEMGGLCCSGYTEKINIDGNRTCTTTKNSPEISCLQDNDCGLNICDCKAMNDSYIKPAEKACMRVCSGTPKCVEGECRLIK